jgi:hypothetical protein
MRTKVETNINIERSRLSWYVFECYKINFTILKIASYGIIMGGNSSHGKKRIIRIMVGAHPSTSCRRLFKKLDILTVPSQYIYSLMNFFIGNQEKFQTNSSVHNINTRNKHHLHRLVANL